MSQLYTELIPGFVLCILLSIISGFSFTLRSFTRRLKRIKLRADDWLSLAGLVSLALYQKSFGNNINQQMQDFLLCALHFENTGPGYGYSRKIQTNKRVY